MPADAQTIGACIAQEAAMSDPSPSLAPATAPATSSATTTTGRAQRRFPRSLIVALTLLAAFVAFEMCVRLIQPDALTYTTNIEVGLGQDSYHYAHGTTTDPHTVAQWYTTINATPLDQDNVFVSPFEHCTGLFFNNSYHFEFTWHGLPIESVSSSNNGCGTSLWMSRGGLTDPRAYTLPYALQRAIP